MTKLALRMERKTIERAWRFARGHNRSLSEIVASYLDRLTGQSEAEAEADPEAAALSDEIPVGSGTDADDAKHGYVRDKYLNG